MACSRKGKQQSELSFTGLQSLFVRLQPQKRVLLTNIPPALQERYKIARSVYALKIGEGKQFKLLFVSFDGKR